VPFPFQTFAEWRQEISTEKSPPVIVTDCVECGVMVDGTYIRIHHTNDNASQIASSLSVVIGTYFLSDSCFNKAHFAASGLISNLCLKNRYELSCKAARFF
jgi:hypothetical protein